jgi:D-alanyl-D-alanine carboxypeptidase/D-alanyl-D-alanine-endopeptidase (penicillin-binding protein 4)
MKHRLYINSLFVFCVLYLLPPVFLQAQYSQAQATNKRGQVAQQGADRQGSATASLSGLSIPASTGLYVFEVDSGREIFSKNADTPFKPASVLKLITAAAILDRFGPFHTIPTEILATGVAGSHVDTLYVKGFGDPGLRQEELWGISRRVYLRGVRSISKIVVDDSSFVNPPRPSGQRAYQAGVSALSFNYNTITFEVCPLIGQSKALVTHDPREVPIDYSGTISVVNNKGAAFSIDQAPGTHHIFPMQYRLSGVVSPKAGCQEVYRSVSEPALYLGHALRGFLDKEGIRSGELVKKGKTPKGAAVIYTYRSKPIKETINLLNTHSNNMIADQLVMLLGKGSDGSHTMQQGLANVGSYLTKRGISSKDFSLHDGSGLSHSNRVTARALALVLRDSLKADSFNVEFEASLPVSGKSGTLRRRSYPGLTRAKTGTINGVVTLAGSVNSGSGRKLGFVLLQNQVTARDRAINLEKTLIDRLRKL